MLNLVEQSCRHLVRFVKYEQRQRANLHCLPNLPNDFELNIQFHFYSGRKIVLTKTSRMMWLQRCLCYNYYYTVRAVCDNPNPQYKDKIVIERQNSRGCAAVSPMYQKFQKSVCWLPIMVHNHILLQMVKKCQRYTGTDDSVRSD